MTTYVIQALDAKPGLRRFGFVQFGGYPDSHYFADDYVVVTIFPWLSHLRCFAPHH